MTKKALAVVLAAALLCSCGNNAGSESTDAVETATEDKATPEVASAGNAQAQASITPTITPEPVSSYEETWAYKIVQNGYYNAAATWDEDGNITAQPVYEPGNEIYFNDADEYYNNFVSGANCFGGAELVLDDEEAHSGDNSVKVTSRIQESNGFTGFGLLIDGHNHLDLTQLQGRKVKLGLWVYYKDDFNMGAVDDTLTFAIYSSLNPTADAASETGIPAPEYIPYKEITDEDRANLSEEEIWAIEEENDSIESANWWTENYYDRKVAELERAHELGFYKIAESNVEINTWRYIEVETVINMPEGTDQLPMLAVTTLGEINDPYITFYNPFYVDDITLTLVE